MQQANPEVEPADADAAAAAAAAIAEHELEDERDAIRLTRVFAAGAAPTPKGAPTSSSGGAGPADPPGSVRDGDDRPLGAEDAGSALWDLTAARDGAKALLSAADGGACQLLLHVLGVSLERLAAMEGGGQQVGGDGGDGGDGDGDGEVAAGALQPARAAELALGILGNLLSHAALSSLTEERLQFGGREQEQQQQQQKQHQQHPHATAPAALLLATAALFCGDAPAAAEACRVCCAALALGGRVAGAWLAELSSAEAALERAVQLLASAGGASGFAPLAERSAQLLAALMAADAARAEQSGEQEGAAAPVAAAADASLTLLDRLLAAGLLDAVSTRLEATSRALEDTLKAAGASAASPGGGWEREEEEDRAAAAGGAAGGGGGGGAAAAATPSTAERFDMSASLALASLVIEIGSQPGGGSAVSADAAGETDDGGDIGGDGGGDGGDGERGAGSRFVLGLLRLLSAAVAADAGGGALRDRLLMAAVLLPPVASAVAARAAEFAPAVAEALADNRAASAAGDGDADVVDAAYYLLALAARRQQGEQGEGEEEARVGRRSAAAAAWREVAGVLARVGEAPKSSAAYAAAFERALPEILRSSSPPTAKGR